MSKVCYVTESVMAAYPGASEAQETRLTSPVYHVTQPGLYCLSFRYMLYGSGTGQLMLYLRYLEYHLYWRMAA